VAIWNRLTAFITGGAVATAASDAIAPELEPLKQTAWRNAPHRVLDPSRAAEVYVKQIPTPVDLQDDAARSGTGSARFAAMIELAKKYPGASELLELWRRGIIKQDELTQALRRQGVPDEWIGHLSNLKDEVLDPSVVALGVVRSILPSEGLLAVDLDTGPGKVPRYRVSDVSPTDEAARSGVEREHLRIMVGEIGLPMATDAAAQSYFRGLIERSDFNAAVAEGDTRPEWADAILEHARQIPSVADYVNAHIRGWITAAEMHDGAARHGMSKADVDLLYLRTGRPAAPGQMATAAARGIDGPEGRPMDREQFLKGIAESDIRPEWGPMLWESRYLYPPLFQITRLVQAGAIDTPTAVDWATKDRYPPEVVSALEAFWNEGAGGGVDSHVGKAQTQLWGSAHRSYLAGESTKATARGILTQLGVSAADGTKVLQLWDSERSLIRKQLTPAQVKKAYKKAVTNEDTGQPWTRDDALAGLIERGYSHTDATTFLDS
jgi:hypothetical protein